MRTGFQKHDHNWSQTFRGVKQAANYKRLLPTMVGVLINETWTRRKTKSISPIQATLAQRVVYNLQKHSVSPTVWQKYAKIIIHRMVQKCCVKLSETIDFGILKMEPIRGAVSHPVPHPKVLSAWSTRCCPREGFFPGRLHEWPGPAEDTVGLKPINVWLTKYQSGYVCKYIGYPNPIQWIESSVSRHWNITIGGYTWVCLNTGYTPHASLPLFFK